MANLQNTSNTSTNSTNKAALVTDLNSSYVGNDQYSYARNAVRNSKEGDLGTIGNEPSNEFCFSAPYKIIGNIPLTDDNVVIFSTNNISSEIGLGNTRTCTYSKLINDPCLNFNDNYLITGEAKKHFQKGNIITFTDKYNPVRRIELKNITSIQSCDDILLWKKIQHPCISVQRGQVGNMPNGMYSVAIAYVVNNQIFSDYYSITNRIALFSEISANSLEIKISDLDKEFKEFALIVVGNYIDPVTKGVTKLAKQIGIYSTKIRSISVTDFINSNYEEIPLGNLVIQKRSWLKAGIITSNSNYLLLGDLVTREEENYQLKAMGIEAEYVVEQVPADYYENDGTDVGYYRDENYDYYIQGVYNTGELTDKFHIGGRKATAFDLAPVSTADVYEYDTQFNDCVAPGVIPRWKIENTAGKLIEERNEFKCDRRVLGTGKMGYVESTDLYPDNIDTYGTDAGKPIRFHKMPDECKVPRYSKIDGKEYINILGVRFSNIKPFDNPDIVGYKITRSDRKGGNGTVVARGLMTNMRSYTDNSIDQTVLYSNYTVNDLTPDQFISSTQTVYKDKKEHNFNPLSDYHKNRFSFYSPHTLFEPRYTLGTEVKIESEEIADITGQFDIVYKHPREKLMNQFAFWLSAAVGFIQSSLVLLGKTDISSKSGLKIGLDGGVYYELSTGNIKIETVGDLIGLSIGDIIDTVVQAAKTLDPTKIGTIINLIKAIIQSIAALGLKVPYSILAGIKEADDIFTTIYNFTGYTDYVYQYNAHALFNDSICVKEGNKRRRLLTTATYIPSTVVSVDNDMIMNNLFREKCVYFHLNKDVSVPSTKDTSRKTISGFGVCDNPTDKVKSTGSAYYATSKVVNPNQYGEVGSSASVSMHSCPFTTLTSPILYGGDCVITRFSFLRKMQFFSQNIANTNYPDGTEYDYRKYRNIGYPRFWMDSTKYDFSELLSSNVINFAKFSRTTSSKHNLDCKKSKDGGSISRIDNAYMYLSNNCAMDFFVEADYNVDFREKTEQPFFSKKSRNLSQIFRSDRLLIDEEFNISRAFSDLYTTEIFAQQQRADFNPADPIPTNQPNSVIYSLPSFNLQEPDNWQYFLPANFFAFSESDYGNLTGIHKIDQDRLIFLFTKASPFVSMGRDILQLEQSGRKITVGDGGLFAQDPRETMPTDNNYAACNSRYAFSNTHVGRFYPSENQGRIISFDQNPDDITRQGMAYWCKNYMPIFLYNYFPDYPREENPATGVGYLTVFDSASEIVYITKRDFSPKKEFVQDITYKDGSFFYKGLKVSLRSNYFNDISWTLSYSALDKAFVSWHDWHPDLVIQRDNHFLTIKDNGVWKHNERYDSFCNFYDKDYPFELEIISSSGKQIEIVRSLEYLLEVYLYKNSGRDRFHVLNQNFDRLFVWNSEQISPLLWLVKSSSNPEDRVRYPNVNTSNSVSYNILFDKEENKYRVNQFWDSVKDRGEFDSANFHLLATDESGYKQTINIQAIDINKPEEQRKKFRHYFNKFRLTRAVSGAYKFLMKVIDIKKVISPR